MSQRLYSKYSNSTVSQTTANFATVYTNSAHLSYMDLAIALC